MQFSHRGHGLIKTTLFTIVYDVIMLAVIIGMIFLIRSPMTEIELLIMLFVFVISYVVINSGLMYWLMNHYISV